MSREWRGAQTQPDRLYMLIQGLSEDDAQFLAEQAVIVARRDMPKMSGDAAEGLAPVWGAGWFGVRWEHDYVWYQEAGIKAFTMRSLAGKTIPMWINDPTGSERRKNPRAETRVTASGITQVLIFRKAAPIGSTKPARRKRQGRMQTVQVPRSYPGATGRVTLREMRRPWTTPGRVGGAIAARNIGIRWRHPGLHRRNFIRQGLIVTAEYHGFYPGPIRDGHGRFR